VAGKLKVFTVVAGMFHSLFYLMWKGACITIRGIPNTNFTLMFQ